MGPHHLHPFLCPAPQAAPPHTPGCGHNERTGSWRGWWAGSCRGLRSITLISAVTASRGSARTDPSAVLISPPSLSQPSFPFLPPSPSPSLPAPSQPYAPQGGHSTAAPLAPTLVLGHPQSWHNAAGCSPPRGEVGGGGVGTAGPAPAAGADITRLSTMDGCNQRRAAAAITHRAPLLSPPPLSWLSGL